MEFLKTSPWGRCVYHCDNNVVDHQVVACEMENGVTASLTMTAFDCDRTIEIHGTRGSLRGGEPYQNGGAHELWFCDHYDGKIEEIPVEQPKGDGYASHGGGDTGIVDALDRLFAGPAALSPGLDGLAGHRLAYQAEESRLADGAPRK
jgi:predicted dehydrogenase